VARPGRLRLWKGLRQVLQETIEVPRSEARQLGAGLGVASFPGRPDGLRRLEAIALPVLCVFAAATAIVFAHDGRHASIATAAIVAALYIGALELIGRSTWLSPLALGVPVTTALGMIVALPVISLLDFWIPGFNVSGLDLIFITFATFAVWSLYWRWPPARLRQLRRRVLVVGYAGGGSELAEDLESRHDLPFECAGIVDDDRVSESWIGSVDHLREIIVRQRIDIVVFADLSLRDRAMPALLDVGRLDLRVVGLPDFYEHAFGRVPIDHLPQTWFMSLLYLYRGGYPLLFKRMIDVSLASLVLLCTAPLYPLLALLIVLESRGPVFFRQVRIGEGGHPFEIIKFRTMVNGAEAPGRAVWAQDNDSRITRIGKLLRKTRLDELPQLWNVIRGDMSLIGPRPERPEFLELLERMVPHWSRRNLVKPGITGWAQVCCGYTSDASSALEKLSYDLYYIKHRSPILDFAVAAKTATVIFSGSGAK
jgi:exopolysaccharide biosynthesis polyprenyl glycosylphosphotransferase